MGGGLLQLVAYGNENIYLNGNPQITFFKSVYRRYTNFAMENIEESLIGRTKLSFNEKTEYKIKIPRRGDLIHNIYLTFNLPDIYSNSFPHPIKPLGEDFLINPFSQLWNNKLSDNPDYLLIKGFLFQFLNQQD